MATDTMALSGPSIFTLGLGMLNLLAVWASDTKDKSSNTLWIMAWTVVVVVMVEALYRRDYVFLSWFIAMIPVILGAIALIFAYDMVKKAAEGKK